MTHGQLRAKLRTLTKPQEVLILRALDRAREAVYDDDPARDEDVWFLGGIDAMCADRVLYFEHLVAMLMTDWFTGRMRELLAAVRRDLGEDGPMLSVIVGVTDDRVVRLPATDGGYDLADGRVVPEDAVPGSYRVLRALSWTRVYLDLIA